jgi:peroxiredoxin
MKILKLFITATLLSIITTTATAGGDTGYNLKFKIKGLQKDSSCYLANYYADKQYIQDTAKANANGEVVFTGKEKLKGGMYLLVLPKKKYFDFLIDQVQDFTLETDTADFVKNMKIKGSEDNKLFFEYLNYIGPKQKELAPFRELMKKAKNNKDSIRLLNEKINKVDKDVKAYMEDFIKQHPKVLWAKILKAMTDPVIPDAPKLSNGRPDSTFGFRYMRAHYWDNFDFSDQRLLVTPILYNRMKAFMDNMTYQIIDSLNASADIIVEKSRANKEVFKYVVYWLTSTYESSPIMGMEGVFVHMTEKYYMTKQAFWVDSAQNVKITQRAMTLKPILIGKYAPNLVLKDSLLRDVTLYDVHKKFTIVYFWDYNCSHCKKVTPVLLEWYHTAKSKGVEIYAVGTETNAEEWKKYIREHKLDWINVFDPNHQTGFKQTYDIYSTPVIYVLDENKKIIAKRLDVEQLDGLLEHYNKQK